MWPLAVLLWTGGLRWSYGPIWPGLLRRVDAAIFAVLIALFTATWLPFYDNWRFAYTGDSLIFVLRGYQLATHGDNPSLWSVTGGIDDWLTWTQSVSFNWPMLAFEPTLFWHRVGKLLVSVKVLGAVYLFFRIVAGRTWAVMVVVLLAANYNWLWMSHVSYEHIDSQVFAYLGLAVFAALWQNPERYAAWALLGVIAGTSVLFSKIAWGELAAVGVLAVGLACCRRCWFGLLLCVLSLGIAAVPALLQIPTLFRGFMLAAKPAGGGLSADYVLRMAGLALWMPVKQPVFSAGLHGPLFCQPIRSTYIAGSALAAAGLIPALRRRLQIPNSAPILGLLLLWDAALLGVTNGRYEYPSQNRIYHLLPLELFLACVPFVVADQWTRSWRSARWVVRGMALAALGLYMFANIQILMSPQKRSLGQNVYDGLIEMTQRVGQPIVVFSARPIVPAPVEGLEWSVTKFYRLEKSVSVSNDYSVTAVRAACNTSSVVCYELFFDGGKRFEALLSSVPHEAMPVRNSDEVECIRCLASHALPAVTEESFVATDPPS